MKKYLVLVPIVALLVACGTTQPVQQPVQPKLSPQQADLQRIVTQREREINHTLENIPEWMNKLPTDKSMVYGSASAISVDFGMADEKARIAAIGRICVAYGGRVNKKGDVYRLDTGKESSERSEIAIREMCKNVDVAGVEIIEIKRIAEGSRYRSFVLVGLPLGEGNTVKADKEGRSNTVTTDSETRSKQMFNQMDEEEKPTVTPVPPAKVSSISGTFKPASQVTPVVVDNPEYNQRRAEALQKPGAIIGQVTVQ
jgi:hypothetical protein